MREGFIGTFDLGKLKPRSAAILLKEKNKKI